MEIPVSLSWLSGRKTSSAINISESFKKNLILEFETVMVVLICSCTTINKCTYINTIFRGHISIAPLANQLRSNKNPHASTLS